MSEINITPAPKTTAPKVVVDEPTQEKALAKLKEAKEFALTFSGKAGFNPFLYIKERLEPLVQSVTSNNKESIALVCSDKFGAKFEPNISKTWLKFNSIDYSGLILKPAPEALKDEAAQ